MGYDGPDGKRSAFLKAVQEYNNFGVATANPKLRVTEDAALELYAMKVFWSCIARFGEILVYLVFVWPGQSLIAQVRPNTCLMRPWEDQQTVTPGNSQPLS